MSENERAERCETCRFWDAFDETETSPSRDGHCHRYPPHVQDDGYLLHSYNWAGDWCGEWQSIGPDSEQRQCPKLLYVSEASKLLKYTTSQLTRMARSGALPCVFLPNASGVKKEIRFLESELAAWVESHKGSETE